MKEYFADCEAAKTIYAIAHAECKGKQFCNNRGLNKDGSVDFGYLQVNSIHREKGETVAHFEKRMYNLEENFKLASKIYKDREKINGDGFTAWSTYNNKKYLAYLK